MCIYCTTDNYRKIYEAHYGCIPTDDEGRTYEIHHIDGDHSNNAPENLKAVTLQEHYNIHYSQNDWSACQLIALRLKISPEERSKISKLTQEKRVADGTHPFLKDSESRKNAKPSTRVYKKKEQTARPICKICGTRPVAINYHKEGKIFYRKKCDHCAKNRGPGKPLWMRSGYKKKLKCDRCGFVGQHSEQFDVFYVDGNPSNCQYNNLKTVCANCQRILYKLKLPWKRGDLIPDF